MIINTLFFFSFFLVTFDCIALQNTIPSVQNSVIKNGVGLESIITVVTSWNKDKSILPAIFHGLFSWLYVTYHAITRKEKKQ